MYNLCKLPKTLRQVEDIVVRQQEREGLVLSILLLENERDRDFWLLFLDGLNQEQIADRFGVSNQRISVYAQSALERLECNLIKYGVI
jgi:DNA-directed RNA polymerase specialized sigma subunit